MTTFNTTPSGHGTIRLQHLVLSRVCTTAIFMTYPACLSVLLREWAMTATQAGVVQGAFVAAFAISLLVASYLCDRIGAKRVFDWAIALSALAALLFAVFAESYATAIIFTSLVGLTQGGTYTPAIMLVAANVPHHRKASAVGWILAGMSAGYVLSIFLSTTLLALHDYHTAFLASALVTVAGWGLGYYAMRNAWDRPRLDDATGVMFTEQRRRHTRLLTIGYIGHSWELFGAWAWIPAFLAAAVLTRDEMSAVELGLWTALALHLSGVFAAILSGYAANRFGARSVLVAFALLGAFCSATIGWLADASVPLLLMVTAIYGFAIIGDSSVLSSAMTDAAPPARLGRLLGLRSVLGVGTGAVSPVVFGFSLDLASPALGWGVAFATLAAGGIVAFICALLLKR